MQEISKPFKERSLDFVTDYFDTKVENNGYRWWYADIISDDRQYSLVIIGFIGSVFSPYYASARRRGSTNPRAHCALNAVIYGPRKKHWAMTERTGDQLITTAQSVSIGPSAMRIEDGNLVINVNEWTNPLPGRLIGEIIISPGVTSSTAYSLHHNDRHWWWPVAPRATATATFTKPNLKFSGSAYIDTNFGNEPLESGFNYWDWTRAGSRSDENDLTYHTRQIDGIERHLSLRCDDTGILKPAPAPKLQILPASGWRVDREICSNQSIERVSTLEDTPFYARSLVETSGPDAGHIMHESLSLDRFRTRWVQSLLPFRMPRRNTSK